MIIAPFFSASEELETAWQEEEVSSEGWVILMALSISDSDDLGTAISSASEELDLKLLWNSPVLDKQCYVWAIFKRGKQNNPLKGIAVKYQFVDVLGVSSVNKVCQLVREEGPKALPACALFLYY